MEYLVIAWNVENTDEFAEWWNELTDSQQEDITATAELLMEHGPNLPFPHSSGIEKFQAQSHAGITGAKWWSPCPDFLRIRPEALGNLADRRRQNGRRSLLRENDSHRGQAL